MLAGPSLAHSAKRRHYSSDGPAALLLLRSRSYMPTCSGVDFIRRRHVGLTHDIAHTNNVIMEYSFTRHAVAKHHRTILKTH